MHARRKMGQVRRPTKVETKGIPQRIVADASGHVVILPGGMFNHGSEERTALIHGVQAIAFE